jgi:hypothetical protein
VVNPRKQKDCGQIFRADSSIEPYFPPAAMSANDYYSAGKPQEQGGYYPPQGTFIHFPNPRAAPPSPHRILLDQASTCVITYIQDFFGEFVTSLLLIFCSFYRTPTRTPTGWILPAGKSRMFGKYHMILNVCIVPSNPSNHIKAVTTVLHPRVILSKDTNRNLAHRPFMCALCVIFPLA